MHPILEREDKSGGRVAIGEEREEHIREESVFSRLKWRFTLCDEENA